MAIEKKERDSRIADRIKRLDLLAAELRKGGNFPSTRLTILKPLCQDPNAAAHFAVHLARLASKRMKSKFKPLVIKAAKSMAAELRPRTPSARALYKLLNELVTVQDEYKPMKWGSVRIILSKETLLAEHAVNCLLHPDESVFWGYQIVSYYAVRYDSRHPWPLVPASAPLVEDIADFWRDWLVGSCDFYQ